MREKKVLKGIRFVFVVVFLFGIACCKANYSSAQDVSTAFLRAGAAHTTSLIKDAKVHYVIRHHYEDGWRIYKEVNWVYQPGKEFLRVKVFEQNGEVSGDNGYCFDGKRSMTFLYKDDKIVSAATMSREETERTIPVYPPTALFLRFWPVGITLDQILSNERTQLLAQKETIAESQCYVVHLKSVGGNYERLGYKVWLDPQRGFLPRKIEVLTNGQIRIAIGPIILEKFGEDIWFPVRAEFRVYLRSGEGEGPRIIENRIEINQIKINEGIDEKLFSPSLESGMEVYDCDLGDVYVIP